MSTEEALRKSEARFRTAMAAVSGLLWTNNARGEMEGEQPGWAAFTGQTYNEYQGYGWSQAVHPDDVEPTIAAWNLAVSNQSLFEFEHRVRRSDGVWRTFHVRALPLINAQGSIAEWVGVHSDITERRERELNQRFLLQLGAAVQELSNPEDIARRATRLVAQHLRVARCGWMTVNAKNGSFTIRQETVCGNGPSLLGTFPLSMYGDQAFLDELASGHAVAIADARTDPRTAAYFPLSYGIRGTHAVVFVPLLRQDQWLGLLAVAQEIPRAWTEAESEVLRAAAERIWPAYELARSLEAERKAHKLLEASDARLRRLVDADIAGIVIGDERRVLDANAHFLKLLGYSRSDLETDGIPWESITPPEYRQAQHDTFNNLATAGQSLSSERDYLRRDGSRVSVLVSSVLLEIEPQIQILSLVVDQTERRRLEEQFRQAQKLESVGQLAGGVAHDFNNLLTVILGYSDVALSQLSPSHPLTSLLNEISQAADRAAALTRQLLAFSRRRARQPQTLNLGDVVRQVEKMLRRLISENVELAIHLREQQSGIFADPVHIEQVIINLAINARDAMPEGGQLTLETGSLAVEDDYSATHYGVSCGNYVMLTVSDTGVGMSEEVRARIFEPFFTTKEQGKGTGLGLAVVYGVVKESDGTIWVYSEPGQGTTFKLLFPAVALKPVEKPPVRKNRHLEGSETILLAEDEPALRKFIVQTLKRYGYQAIEAETGKQALQLMSTLDSKIDLLLTDLVMPEMGGQELAERFVPQYPGVPILRMSGYAERSASEPQSKDGYLQKPFTATALLERIRSLLDANPAG